MFSRYYYINIPPKTATFSKSCALTLQKPLSIKHSETIQRFYCLSLNAFKSLCNLIHPPFLQIFQNWYASTYFNTKNRGFIDINWFIFQLHVAWRIKNVHETSTFFNFTLSEISRNLSVSKTKHFYLLQRLGATISDFFTHYRVYRISMAHTNKSTFESNMILSWTLAILAHQLHDVFILGITLSHH